MRNGASVFSKDQSLSYKFSSMDSGFMSMRTRSDTPPFAGDENSTPMPHVLIIQNIDSASREVSDAITELMRVRAIPARTKSNFGGSSIEHSQSIIPLPEPFVIICTSCRVPERASCMLPADESTPTIRGALLDCFMLRIPLWMPSKIDGTLELMQSVVGSEKESRDLHMEIAALEAATKDIGDPLAASGRTDYASEDDSDSNSDPDALLDADHLDLVQRAASMHAKCIQCTNDFFRKWPSFRPPNDKQSGTCVSVPWSPRQLLLASYESMICDVQQLHVKVHFKLYLRDIISAIMMHPEVKSGVSGDTEALLEHCARATAVLGEQPYVATHNVFMCIQEVLAHRFVASYPSSSMHGWARARSIVKSVICEKVAPTR